MAQPIVRLQELAANPDSKTPSFLHVAIVGAGLLGTSLLQAVRRRWPEVSLDVYDADTTTRCLIRENGLANVVHDDLRAAANADLIAICTPASAVVGVITALAPHLLPGSVMIDVASVKSELFTEIARKLPLGVHYVSTHPMAGGSTAGAAGARSDLFVNRSCVLVPFDNTPESVVSAVTEFWTSLGAQPGQASPEHHDTLVALTSHLPHLIAYIMMDTLERQLPDACSPLFIGRSLTDFARLGSANPIIWHDILRMNRARVLAHLDVFEAALQDWKAALVLSSDSALAHALQRASATAARYIHPPPGDGHV